MDTPAIVDMPDGRIFHVTIRDDGHLSSVTYADGIPVAQGIVLEIERFVADLYAENEVDA